MQRRSIPDVATATLSDPMTATSTAAPHGKCTATARSGAPCRQPAVAGATVCRFHGGAAPQVRRAAERRLAERAAVASLADVEVLPIGNPLEELARVAEETRAFQRQVAARVVEMTEWTGYGLQGGESLRPMVALLERAYDRVARLLADWTRLGFDERMVTLQERQAELVEAFVLKVVADLDLTESQSAAVPDAVVRHLPVLTGGADSTVAA